MADSVIHRPFSVWITGWYRDHLAARPEPAADDVEVDVVEPLPGQPFPRRLLVIRIDPGTEESAVTQSLTLGLTVFAGTKEDPRDADELAAVVLALAHHQPGVEDGNPIAAVTSTTGPDTVPEDQPRARRYATVEVVVVGDPFHHTPITPDGRLTEGDTHG